MLTYFSLKKIVTVVLISVAFLEAFGKGPLRRSYYTKGGLAGIDAGMNVVIAEEFMTNFPASFFQSTGLTLRGIYEYKFTPVMSVRSLLGHAEARWYNKKSDNTFTVEYGALDAKCDILNLLTGNEQRFATSLHLFGGGGLAYRSKIKTSENYIDKSAGLLFLVRLGGGMEQRIQKSLWLTINAELNFTGDKLNGYAAGDRKFDILPCFTVGLLYDSTPKMKGRWDY